MVITDFKLRYQGSVLGYLWSLLRPLFLFVILYLVFVRIIKVGGGLEHYPIYLLLGIVTWNFFAEITTTSVDAVVRRGDLLRKINFPKYVIVASSALSALINFSFNIAVVAFFMVVNGVPLTERLFLVPFFILEIFIFAISLGFILSALYVRLRDVNYIWEVIMQAMFYATPIIYPVSLVLTEWPLVAKLLLFNPVAQAIQDIRHAAVTPQTDTLASIVHYGYLQYVPYVIVAVTLLLAIVLYKRRSPSFAEEI